LHLTRKRRTHGPTSQAAISAGQSDGFSILRFGGSGNDYLTYEFGGTACPAQGDLTECLNRSQWESLLKFTKASSAKMVFGLSMNTGAFAPSLVSPTLYRLFVCLLSKSTTPGSNMGTRKNRNKHHRNVFCIVLSSIPLGRDVCV
jgi:hypothetical protein